MRSLPQFVIFVVLPFAACTHAPSGDGDAEMTSDVGIMRDADVLVDLDADPVCVPLFGVPAERTGLPDGVCGPSCGCDTAPRSIDDDEVAAWLIWAPAAPHAEIVDDPYDLPAPAPPGESYCVLSFDVAAGTYAAETRTSLPTDSAILTHSGPCGACSTLQDLATYQRNPDLTDPVRECGLQGIRDGEEANLACLEALGFSRPCAQIWYFNTNHTRRACLTECFAALNEPYHLEDGSLNPCLECDEVNSGSVFKAVAGRTRRNSGLASAICRPCDSVTMVSHDYPVR